MSYIALTSFWMLMLYAAYSDLKSYTLPNFISLLLVVGFSLAVLVVQPSLTALAWHIAVGIILFVCSYVVYATGPFGAGDVKMISTLGLWMGPVNILPFLMIMSIIGGIIGVALLIFRRFPIPEKWLENQSVKALHSKEEGIPYGIAIAFAALIEFPKTEIYTALSGH